jgi:hypothetical protein
LRAKNGLPGIFPANGLAAPSSIRHKGLPAMKSSQAWGWLVAGVLAAGLNATYHEGGLQWAHQIADRVGHSSAAVLALASGHPEQFLTEARWLTARNETPSCELRTAWARMETRLASKNQIGWARLDAMSAREQSRLDRLEANRERMEAEIQARVDAGTARIRVPAVALNSIVVHVPQVSCPRVRVSLPRVRISAPMVSMPSDNGPL